MFLEHYAYKSFLKQLFWESVSPFSKMDKINVQNPKPNLLFEIYLLLKITL